MKPHVTKAAEQWITGRVARNEITPQTARVYRRAIAELVEAIGDIPAHHLTRHHAETWMEHTAHLGAHTRKHRHGIIRHFCDWLIDEAHLEGRNPFRLVKPPQPPRRPPRALSAEAVRATLRACRTSRDRLIVLLMVQQGLRCVGVANLTVQDVDLAGGVMRVREKFGHERTLPIVGEVSDAIRVYLSEHPAGSGPLVRCWRPHQPYPVASDRPMLPASISRLVSGLMDEAGVKLAPGDGRSAHALRHTCATSMLEGGADLLLVRDVLGHQSLATTQGYLSSDASRLAAALGGRSYA